LPPSTAGALIADYNTSKCQIVRGTSSISSLLLTGMVYLWIKRGDIIAMVSSTAYSMEKKLAIAATYQHY
jgi:hypothetical protein